MRTARRFALVFAAQLIFVLAPNTLDAQGWQFEILAESIVGAWTRVGDVDGDGDSDIFVQHGDTLFWYENLRPGWTRHLIDPLFINSAFSWVEDVDMDNDGDPDLLHAIYLNPPGTIAWNENRMNGTEWERHVITSEGRGSGVFQGSFGDIDGDGDTDIAMPEISVGEVSWFESHDSGASWSRHSVTSLPSAIWTSVADLDGDSDPDIAAGSVSSGAVYWYENIFPDTVWIPHYIALLPGSVIGEAVDIDGDGDTDIMTHNSSTLVYYDNPSWNVSIIADGFSGLYPGRAGDLDDDGDTDLTYGGDGFGSIGDIGWVENPAGAGTWKRHDIDVPSLLQRLPTGLEDIDGDGDTDLTAYTFNVSTAIGDALWYSNPMGPSSIGDGGDHMHPERFVLFQNYPNPFNPTTEVEFLLSHSGFTTLKVYDFLGREIDVLVNQDLIAGKHRYSFNARDLATGIYIYRLTSGAYSESRRMLLLR